MICATPEEHDEQRHWLEALLLEQIPFATHMQLRVARLDERGIGLDCPLSPSVNDKGTAFGGALASAMILAGWSLPRLLLRRHGLSADLVIGRCELKFLAPVHGAYTAECEWPDPDTVSQFLRGLEQHGKGRLDLSVHVLADGELAATLEARYAALRPTPDLD